MNQLFFEESIHDNFRIRLQIDKILAQEQSQYQSILIFTNKEFGTVLALDGIVQATEADEHIYHEMMAHVPLAAMSAAGSSRAPLRGAIIGGGDGGVLREVVKHPILEHCTMIDIDDRVIELSKIHLPGLSDGAFNHPKATVLAQDGAAWLKDARDLDFVLIDSSDPVGPNESLFNEAFYVSLSAALKPDGIVVKQSGCTLVQPEEAVETLGFYKKHFKSYGLYRQNVPTYVGGDMTFAWACKAEWQMDQRAVQEPTFPTKHYTKGVHDGCFAMPRQLADKVKAIKAL
jgi:spermidine synthase